MKFDYHLIGEITIEDAKEVCQGLLSKPARKDVSIFLTSAGGDVDGALAVGAAIQSIQRQGFKVHIHVGGVAHSAAVLLLQFANRRTAEEYTSLRIHPMQAWFQSKGPFTLSDINGEHSALSHSHYIYYEVIKRRSGRDLEDMLVKSHHLKQDLLLLPQECLEWNLIDEIFPYCVPSSQEGVVAHHTANGSLTPLAPGAPRRASSGNKTTRRKKSAVK